MPDLDAVLRVLHELIDFAHAHGLPAHRVAELHQTISGDEATEAPAPQDAQ